MDHDIFIYIFVFCLYFIAFSIFLQRIIWLLISEFNSVMPSRWTSSWLLWANLTLKSALQADVRCAFYVASCQHTNIPPSKKDDSCMCGGFRWERIGGCLQGLAQWEFLGIFRLWRTATVEARECLDMFRLAGVGGMIRWKQAAYYQRFISQSHLFFLHSLRIIWAL